MPAVFDEKLGFVRPIEAARRWLADQLEQCPIRLDRVRRSVLFEEVEAAVTSVDNMNHHTESILNSNQWCSYEVFLKAAWRYLVEQNRAQGTVAAVVLLKMIQLYRRRSGHVFQKAAIRHLKNLRELVGAIGSHSPRWLDGVATYEEAYMRFLIAPDESETEAIFLRSADAENRYGRLIGILVSRAQSRVVAVRRSLSNPATLERHLGELSQLREELSGIEGPLAASWADASLPAFLAYGDIALGRHAAAIDALASRAAKGDTTALWYRGIGLVCAGAAEQGLRELETARRAFYTQQRTEGRGALLVALGDACQILRRSEEARIAYSEATRQAPHMDNRTAIEVANARLSANFGGTRSPLDVYRP